MLFVVPDSPASKDGKLKCGDRLLAVDGHSLECVPHSSAVTMLKQVNTLELSTNICEVSQRLQKAFSWLQLGCLSTNIINGGQL